MKDTVMPNNSQVKFKKTEVEDHHRISSNSNKTKSVTACNDNLKSRTLNVNAVCATCGKCLFNSDHYACVSKFLNDVNARTKKPNVVPIVLENPKVKRTNLLQHILRKQLHQNPLSINPRVTIRCCYGYLVIGNIMINRVYYVEGLNHNLFSVGQFYDADLEVAFRKSTCFVRDLQGNNLLTVVSKVDRLEYAYAVYLILPAILNQFQIVWEVEFFKGWKPLSPLQLDVEVVMSE
ncbi:hypothetical protein Tco_0255117 [Tanacetum coccineum]